MAQIWKLESFALLLFNEETTRIYNEHHSLIVEIPYDIRSGSEKVKAFQRCIKHP